MKKLLALLLSLFLIISLVACGPDETPDDDKLNSDDGTDGTPDADDGTDDTTDYGPEDDPAVPDIDWELPV